MIAPHCHKGLGGTRPSRAAREHRAPGWHAAAGLLCLTLLVGNRAAADLVGYWSFEADDASDGSAYGNDGT